MKVGHIRLSKTGLALCGLHIAFSAFVLSFLLFYNDPLNIAASLPVLPILYILSWSGLLAYIPVTHSALFLSLINVLIYLLMFGLIYVTGALLEKAFLWATARREISN
jgi:hypothetical protein